MSFLDALRPPVEERGGADQVRASLEGDAALGLSVFELINTGEMAIGERGVGQRPQMFGRLELG